MSNSNTATGGLIGWFASNHVAANLLMLFIVVSGVYVLATIKKEAMPPSESDEIRVDVQLLGGTPEEVENSVLLKIESAVTGIDGVRQIRSTAFEGRGAVRMTVEEGVDSERVLNDVKLAVDGISSFPAEMERPLIHKYQGFYGAAINVQVSGEIDEATLKELTEQFHNELLGLEGISYVDINGARPYEISIEIPESVLNQYNLSIPQVAGVIRSWSTDLPGGLIQSDAGVIRLRAKGQSYTGAEFEEIVLLTTPDGVNLKLGDIATVRDGFSSDEYYSFFNGVRSMGLVVRARANENEIRIADTVKEWVEQRQRSLPDTITLTTWADSSYYLQGRLNTMLSNLGFGAFLVLIVLGVFLRFRTAAWVVAGLPVAILGALMFMPVVNVTLNIVSLFGFIVVLGIVVDDAIIVAESVDAETQRHGFSTENVVKGVNRVALPAMFGVLTTAAAFTPLIFATGPMSVIYSSIGWVVVLCLLFSLIESKLILPSHLALMNQPRHTRQHDLHAEIDRRFNRFVDEYWLPALKLFLEFRYATLAFFLGLLLIAIGLILGGALRQTFFPEYEDDFVNAQVALLEGSSPNLLGPVVDRMNAALEEVNEDLKAEFGSEQDVVLHRYGWTNDGMRANFQIELAKSEFRTVTPGEVADRWREKVGEISGTENPQFSAGGIIGGGPSLALGLSGPNGDSLDAAAIELTEYIKLFEGLHEVSNSVTAGPGELELMLRPEGTAAGLTLADLAGQVREAFYGYEAQRVQRGESEVRVMVRYPESDRKSVGNLESMWIRMPDGTRAPFSAVAEYREDSGYELISRVDGRRMEMVTAQVDTAVVSPQAVISQARQEFVPYLAARYPDVTWGLAGASQDEETGRDQLVFAFAATLLVVYALIAIPLKSYIQPLVIMSVIPFGIIGAIFGHLFMNFFMRMDFNMVSMIGCIALSGIVVNDSLLLVHFINARLAEGSSLVDAILNSSKARFRAIVLTSLTTFCGLIPIVTERSLHSKLISPMAVSIAFGILFATLITLVIVPVALHILADLGWRRTASSQGRTEQIVRDSRLPAS